MNSAGCIMCRGRAADADIQRVEVWQDDLWRLTISLASEVAGFAYLEPKRHVPSIADLDGPEAQTFGTVMAACCTGLKQATDTDLVYVYIFGDGVPHLHVHLAPHREGDGLNDHMIKGEFVEEDMPNGMTQFVSKDYPPLPRAQLEAVARRVRESMKGS